MNDGIFTQIFGELFTKEEWDLWVKGEFSLFDNYVKRSGMSNEDANRLKNKSNKTKLNANNSYEDFIKNPIKLPNKQ
jgi:hypothetical protein|tara:strand:+ start:692 stop:922 length:231 start_codon:yes stop_codon:yes gene_type:complete